MKKQFIIGMVFMTLLAVAYFNASPACISAATSRFGGSASEYFNNTVYGGAGDAALTLMGYCGEKTKENPDGTNAVYKEIDENKDGIYDTLRISGSGRMGEFQKELNDPTEQDKDFFDDHPKDIETVYIEGVTNVAGMTDWPATRYVLGDSVKDIDRHAFYACDVEEITSSGLETIGEEAFALSHLKEYNVPDSVTSIGSGAFFSCAYLKSVTIGKGVTEIETNCFSNCKLLENIVIPGNVKIIDNYTFSQCPKLKSVTLMPGVETVKNNAFSYCEVLEKVELPDTVTDIGVILDHIDSIKEIKIPGSVKSIGTYVADSCNLLSKITIGEGLEEISCLAKDCPALKEIDLPASLNTFPASSILDNCPNVKTAGPVKGYNINYGWTDIIPENAFYSMKDLESVSIASTITSIGKNAFYKCGNLNELALSDSVETIGDSAFMECTGLTGLDIGASSRLVSIGNSSFYNCISLTKLHLQEGFLHIGDNAFYGCGGIIDVYIPSTLKEIGNGVFKKCQNIKTAGPAGDGNSYSVKLGVTDTIPPCLFQDNEYLVSVVIPSGVTQIGASAFNGCKSLSNVTMPDSVQRIDTYAFASCSSLNSIHIPAELRYLGTYGFSGCTGITEMRFPISVSELYKNAVPANDGITVYGYDNSPSDFRNNKKYKYVSLGKACAVLFYDPKTEKYIEKRYVEVNSEIGTVPDRKSTRPEWVFQCWVDGNNVVCTSDYNVGNNTSVTFYAKYYVNGVPEYIPANKNSSTSSDKNASGGSNKGKLRAGNVFTVGKLTYKIINKEKNGRYNVACVGCKHSAKKAVIGNTVKIKGVICNVTSIASGAFIYCNKLKNVTIGKSVKKIGSKAFYKCEKLSRITIKSTYLSKNSVGKNAFYRTKGNGTVSVPGKKLSAYKKLLKERGYSGNVRKI